MPPKWLRFAIAILTALLFIALTFLVVHFLFLQPSFSPNPPPEICHTEACISSGAWLNASLNLTIDPCTDFYSFACTNWMNDNPIPDDQPSLSPFVVLDNQVIQSLRDMMERQPEVPTAKAVQMALDLYRECMDLETREKLGITPIKDLLSRLLQTSWPILHPKENSSSDFNSTSFVDTYIRFKSIGISPIIAFYIGTDLNRTEHKIIDFHVPNFGLGRKQFANVTEYSSAIAAYKKFARDALTMFAGEEEGQVEAEVLQMRLDEIFEFERKLALFSRRQEESRDIRLTNTRMTLAEFSALTSNIFNWTELLGTFTAPFDLPYNITESNFIIVSDIPYYKQMVQLVTATPPHILYNYMGHSLVAAFSSYADSRLQAIGFEFMRVVNGVKEDSPQWEKCLTKTRAYYGVAMSRLYIDAEVVPGTKERAEEMIADLRAAFEYIVRHEATWLDEATRAKTLEKAAATRYDVAYPEWIRDNELLDEYYQLEDGSNVTVAVCKGQFFQTIIDLKRFGILKSFREFNQPRNFSKEMLMPSIVVNAMASMTTNAVALPAALLQPPFFDPDRPAYLNYARIGEIIGHEITHHFDDEGSQHDKEGKLENWWTEETRKRFDNGSKCFAEQYGSIVDVVTGKKLNPINTAGENIADNAAVREAFYAFQAMAKRRKLQLVPQMENWTFEQLFFIAYGQNYCSNQRIEVEKQIIDSGAHTPDRYRANVALGNFEQFAKAFNCPLGTPMNPERKCRLW